MTVATLADLMIKIGIDPDGVEKGTKAIGAKLEKLWSGVKKGAAIAGAAIAAALIVGIGDTLEQSKLQGVLAAQLGAGPELAGDLGKLSGQVYAAGFGEDMPAVTSAIRSAAQQGLIDMGNAADAASQSTVKSLLTVATVVEEETDRVSAAVTTMLQTGLAGSAEEAMDLLVKATQIGVNKAGDLMDTFEEYSTLFRSLGLDGQHAIGLLSQGLQAGARNADQVADGLKELGIRAIDGSEAAREAYKLLGLDADRMTAKIAQGGPAAAEGMNQILDGLRAMKDPVDQNTAGVGLLGTKWEDMRDAVLALDLNTAAAQMDGFTGATKAAGDTIQETAGQKLDRFKRAAKQALVDKLAEAVPYIEKTFGWLQKNSGWVTPLATGLGILAAVIGTIILVLKVWTAVQTVLNLALWTSPITWIVLAVIALVAIIVIIATKTDWFQKAWSWAWDKIKAGIAFVWNWIKQNWPLLLAIITGPIGLAVLWITKNWDKIKAGAGAVKDWIVEKWDALLGFFKGLPKKISAAASGMWDGIKNAFRAAINWLIDKWNGLSLSIPSINIPGLGKVGGFDLRPVQIPRLADGGIVPATPGGRLVVAGEGGKDEAVVPLPRGARDFANGGAGGTLRVETRGGGTPLERLLAEWFQRAVRTGAIQLTVRGGRVAVSHG
ncbi:phage tail tape measure protein [Micromonospora sp. NPDC048999]|uniref:phage tail tape measure protein n=1 Tax=Micromonospora sp. NPDC048999 TaxID=3155391 RepID=UPI0033CBB7DD